jgi:hypothetical protein
MQEAYRKGDLDLMDSLETITNISPAFTEKFLFKRNEIQANSIDTILNKRSLFVGVGAAHLPGERGVIQLLRKKGYTLRPIFMQNRDASQKEVVDKMRVPVLFKSFASDDGFVKMQVPGSLFKREEARVNESWQFADMNNGSYYMLTRVRNHAAMLGDNEKVVLKKLDSILYENIPGRILKKTVITRGGYSGYDITNKTRRGDLQRYNIFVTPFEVLVFKMSGNDGYVEGKEAEVFFSSIHLTAKDKASNWSTFEPLQGGFTVKLPQTPNQALNKKNTDRINRWEYEALDEKTGDAYMIWKKSVYNVNFLEEDTFDLTLIEESFRKSDIIDKQVSKKFEHVSGVPYVDLRYVLKNGQYIKARAYIKGPHYYLLAARGSDQTNEFTQFFNSFAFTSYKYSPTKLYTDSILNFVVKTAVYPDLDQQLRSLLNKTSPEDFMSGAQSGYDYWPKSKNGWFESDSTGEAIHVSVETFPKYYYSRDSAKFWRDRLEDKKFRKDMVVQSKEFYKLNDASVGYTIALVDTNSSRKINMRYLLKDNSLFKFVTITDTGKNESAFVNDFFASFRPSDKKLGSSVFENKLDLFFTDYYSSDSSTRIKASSAIPNIYFGKNGVSRLIKAINDLRYGDKDYFEIKSRLINELGYIDNTASEDVVKTLKELYKKTADTSYFQNAIFVSLARLKTKESFTLLKEMLLQDPPVFDNSYEYARLFNYLSDTLPLAKIFFPEILQLAQVEDYKVRLNSLLRNLVDSGYIKARDYESYFSKLYFDSKVQLKKQQVKDEKVLEKSTRPDDEENFSARNYRNVSATSRLEDYMVLLMPFYNKNAFIPAFYNKLLQSKDADVQLDALMLMVKNNKPVPDSIFNYLASKDQYRAKLLARLEKIKRTDLFPIEYKKQEDIARSLLLADKTYDKLAKIEFVKKRYMELKDQKGYVYFFKYKIKNDDEWQMGISGLQPVDITDVSSNDDLVKMTEKKLKQEEPVDEQFETQLKRMMFGRHKSSRNFYTNSSYRNFFGSNYDLDDDDDQLDEDEE